MDLKYAKQVDCENVGPFSKASLQTDLENFQGLHLKAFFCFLEDRWNSISFIALTDKL